MPLDYELPDTVPQHQPCKYLLATPKLQIPFFPPFLRDGKKRKESVLLPLLPTHLCLKFPKMGEEGAFLTSVNSQYIKPYPN